MMSAPCTIAGRTCLRSIVSVVTVLLRPTSREIRSVGISALRAPIQSGAAARAVSIPRARLAFLMIAQGADAALRF